MQPDVQSGVKTWQWVVTAIVVVVLIIIGIWAFGSKDAAVTDLVTDDTSAPTAGAINRIVMSDQYPGNVVYLSSVQFEKAGWVVIQANNAGKPGTILGQAYFTAGINPGKITLSQSLIDGNTYYAVMYSDNGDKTFSATSDKPLVDSKGSIIMKVFRAAADAASVIKG